MSFMAHSLSFTNHELSLSVFTSLSKSLHWSDLDKDVPFETLDIDSDSLWLVKLREYAINDIKTLLSSDDQRRFPRDHYGECVEDTLLILGETPPRGGHFLESGAIHQARWMASNIYAGKMLKFSSQMSYDATMINKLKRMNMFLSLFYTSRWLSASIGADASMHDLQFFQDMLKYRSINKEIADIVLRKLKNHRWYPTEEVVPFVLFSTSYLVDNGTKHDIAARINSTPMPDEFRLGKPVFREVDENISLADLVGSDSYMLFRALKINTDWLAKPVIEWHSDPAFITAETFVRTIKVVNDTAERKVKLITDFAKIITSDPEQRAA